MFFFFLSFFLFPFFCFHCTVDKLQSEKFPIALHDQVQDGASINLDLLMIPFGIIQHSTNHFSDQCKLGQGGFGPVYKVMINVLNFSLIS